MAGRRGFGSGHLPPALKRAGSSFRRRIPMAGLPALDVNFDGRIGRAPGTFRCLLERGRNLMQTSWSQSS
jgi:hypothetical protein